MTQLENWHIDSASRNYSRSLRSVCFENELLMFSHRQHAAICDAISQQSRFVLRLTSLIGMRHVNDGVSVTTLTWKYTKRLAALQDLSQPMFRTPTTIVLGALCQLLQDSDLSKKINDLVTTVLHGTLLHPPAAYVGTDVPPSYGKTPVVDAKLDGNPAGWKPVPPMSHVCPSSSALLLIWVKLGPLVFALSKPSMRSLAILYRTLAWCSTPCSKLVTYVLLLYMAFLISNFPLGDIVEGPS